MRITNYFVSLPAETRIIMSKTSYQGMLLAFLMLLTGGAVRAESLDEGQARYAAVKFFSPSSQSTRLQAKGQQLVLRSNGHEHGYYIFDRPEGGAVFVADDDGIGQAVLGYTDSGRFDSDNLPIGFQDWLDQVEVLMDAVHEGKINRSVAPRKAGVAVPPLIQTTWNQGWPYNELCPLVMDRRCLTGCVATAMAQVLKYWQWPEHGYGQVSYVDESGCGETLATDLSTHTYDWRNMLSSYPNDGFEYTDAQLKSVATLMRDCGYAVHMSYTLDASSASICAKTMQTYFHYSPTAKDRYRPSYSQDAWDEFICQDLIGGRPVLYSGQSTSSGHEFIIDGADSWGNYHVNWGWGGYQDGYFMLTDLNGYNDSHWMISHLEPDYSPDIPFSYFLSGDGTLTITGAGIMPDNYRMQTAPWLERRDEIRKIVISEGITTVVENFGCAYINDEAYHFDNLEEVVLPEGLLFIGIDAFLGANKLTTVHLPSTLINMDYAFYYCESLRSLHLPKNLEEFNDYLPHLAELTVDEGNPYMMAVDNVLYSKNGKHLLLAPRELECIIIAETTEDILDDEILHYGTPVLSKCMTAPLLPQVVTSFPAAHISERGYLYIPYGSSGYDNWEKVLPPGWIIFIYNIDRIPEMKITWSLDGNTLTISGHGVQKYEEYGYHMAPYYQDRNQVQRLVVEEGVASLCEGGFAHYLNLTEVELPSTMSYIGDWCFASTGINTITCYAKQAPDLGESVFNNIPQNGTLRVPEGADYSAWLAALPEGWKIEVFTDYLITYYLYTGETSSVNELVEWEGLLSSFPNAIGIINPRYKEWMYLTHNVLLEDATAEGGYRCMDFRLTDLSYGYATTTKAPWTGFSVPLSFTITKGEYKRQLTEGYNTVCLPFTIKEEKLPKSCRMYVYSHYDSEKGNAVFSPQSTTEAGHACILKCSKSGVEWLTDLSGMTLSTQQAATDDNNMRGTFVSTEDYQGIGYSPRAKDNVFAPLARYLHPFRACFIIDAPSAPAELRISLSDDTTDIQDLQDLRDSEGEIFNLAGQRLSKARKGVNIIDGKKILR